MKFLQLNPDGSYTDINTGESYPAKELKNILATGDYYEQLKTDFETHIESLVIKKVLNVVHASGLIYVYSVEVDSFGA